MEMSKKYWLIGHLITPVLTTQNYDMVIGETPAGVSGPPPHYHAGLTEFFMVLEGEMEFVLTGEKKLLKQNEFVNIPPNAVHTFSNPSNLQNKWLNIHDPIGWLDLMKTFGIEADQEGAEALSVSGEIIEKLVRSAVDFDMHIV